MKKLVRITVSDFINDAKSVHGDKYDYSMVCLPERSTTAMRVCVVCYRHGEFCTSYSNHINNKRGCRRCANDNNRISPEEFIQRAIKIHGIKYDYSKVNYINSEIKVLICCKRCSGEFYQSPRCHFEGGGCHRCGLAGWQFSRDNFINKARNVHGEKYDYSRVQYTTAISKIDIICHKCHTIFKQTPNSHLNGGGCPVCGIIKRRDTFDDFLDKAKSTHGVKFDYTRAEYINSRIKIQIKCQNGHIFYQQPRMHIMGIGCPECYHKNEHEVGELLKEYFSDWKISSHKMLWKSYGDYKSKRFYDFMLEMDGRKVMVEYDGEQHFYPSRLGGMSQQKAEAKFAKQQMIDALDTQFCHENGILLFRIKYNDDKQARIEELRNTLREREKFYINKLN